MNAAGDILVTVLVAGWVYCGRYFALCFVRNRLFAEAGAAARLAVGLALTPAVVALSALVANSIGAALWILAGTDCLILLLALMTRSRTPVATARADRSAIGLGVVVASLCVGLSYLNGPLVEYLSDAWWHMRHSSRLLLEDSLISSVKQRSASGSLFGHLYLSAGLDSSSYRLQALVAALSGMSMVVTWYATTIVVSGLLGFSFCLLATTIFDRWPGRATAAAVWLIALGGMNTGLRIAGWPAGMGYVLMNLCLLASYLLWTRRGPAQLAWTLLLVSIAGIAFYHYAELYLVAVALGLLLCAFGLKKIADSPYTHHAPAVGPLLGLVLALCVLAVVWSLGYLRGSAPSISALLPVVISVVCVSLSVYTWTALSRSIALGIVVSCGALCLLVLIDWRHLAELFAYDSFPNPNYYDGYIPKFLIGLGEQHVRIPKWEHQLRASLLWTGVVAITASVWLFSQRQSARALWLMILSVGPALLLLSPPLFTIAVTLIPPYGGYRVQFLIPVALVFGLIATRGAESLPGSTALWLRWSRLGTFFVIAIAGAALVPDVMARAGLIGDRPWAKNTNINFHWRLADNHDALISHTSLRYLNDIGEISDAVEEERGAFLSDLATSYYVGAESLLHPVARHPHHSPTGQKYQAMMREFCAGKLSPEQLMQAVQERNRKLGTASPLALRYVIINRDTRNYTAESSGRSCVGETAHLQPWLSEIAEKIYTGEYLSLWKIL